jgi:hypothetical protein
VIAVWVGAGVGATSGESVALGAMLAAALALAAIGYALRLTQPVAYRIEDDGLVVERRRGETRIAGVVEPFDGTATLGTRLGSGGLYGYRGRFRLSTGSWSRAFVTDVRRSTLIRVGGGAIVVSPADPTAFVREVRDA